MRVVILANGELAAPEENPGWAANADLILCADGGVRHALAMGIYPHVVVGDLDSLPLDVRHSLVGRGTVLVPHPRAKDETDLELALIYAADRGATEILVLGVVGGRIDHELGNLFLLAHPRLVGIDVRMQVGEQEVVLIRDSAVFSGQVGDLLSLLPIGGDAHGVETRGLEYPLYGESLCLGPARGISNVFATSAPRVTVRSGMLLAIHTRIHS